MKKTARVPVERIRRRRKKIARRLKRIRLRRFSSPGSLGSHWQPTALRKGEKARTIIAPSFFNLLSAKNHRELCTFLRTVKDLTIKQRRKVCIDFRRVKQFYPDGMLLFYAEVQRILVKRPGSLGCVLPGDPVAVQVLSHLGLLAQFGCSRSVRSSRHDVVHWQVYSGTDADATQGLGAAIESLPLGAKKNNGTLFRSVSEALTNVPQHAYSEPRHDGMTEPGDQGWWMFVRREPGTVTIMFCDLGLGVPYTVPRDHEHEGWLKRRLGAITKSFGVAQHEEGETIRVTVEEKRSRFKMDHRGNGFGNMLETVARCGNGKIEIFSNRGAFSYRCKGTNERSKSYNYADSIYGTVIGWHITDPEVLT